VPYQRSEQVSRPLKLNLRNKEQCDKISLWLTNWLWKQSDRDPYDTKVSSDLLQDLARASKAAVQSTQTAPTVYDRKSSKIFDGWSLTMLEHKIQLHYLHQILHGVYGISQEKKGKWLTDSDAMKGLSAISAA
jgi:hypothetical protein